MRFRIYFFPWLLACTLTAETGYDMWLRYAPADSAVERQYRGTVPAVVSVIGESLLAGSARDELIRGVRGMLGRTLRVEAGLPSENAILLGAAGDLAGIAPAFRLPQALDADGYWLRTVSISGKTYTLVAGGSGRGVLYGAFAWLRKIALGEPVSPLDEKQIPYAPIRWVNQWDNLDGSVERGYGGRSIFWDNRRARDNLTRVADYARLLASLGINGCSINNVNADPHILTPDFLTQVARIAGAMRPWGVQVVLSADFGSPKSVGGLDTFDPASARVAEWWQSRAEDAYRAVPDLGGFVLKADSEGRAGPSAYGRSHADAANVVARALAPHGGALLYRGFVYDHHMDWNNPKNDRARAAYDNFKTLDGKFDQNVVVQIKNGPIDFQVREPVSPLFGALEDTNTALELQVTQEYFGQGRHLVFLGTQWKEILDFDEHAGRAGTPVKALAAGKVFHRPLGGFAGVVNVGLDDNWFGHDMSQSNLFAFGRLAWDPNLPSERIAREWTRLTFGPDPKVIETVSGILMKSWRVYENYTGPLGLQTLTDIVGNHYGVAVEASERNGWGQWHRAGEHGVGMDRSIATGTGYAGQYRPEIARMFESAASCPDDLLLFFHHVPYSHVLHSGKTVIQYIYDSHYEGAAEVASWIPQWRPLRRRIDDDRYERVLAQLEYQAGQAVVWRDAVTSWFLKESGIPDKSGRAGHYPGRIEAESMVLDGYQVVDVVPWETASGGKAVSCPAAQCGATFHYNGPPGWYTIGVEYFDQIDGISNFELLVSNQIVDRWVSEDRLPTRKLDGSSSTRRTISGVALRPGDEIRIEGFPGGGETAAFDYIEIKPDSR